MLTWLVSKTVPNTICQENGKSIFLKIKKITHGRSSRSHLQTEDLRQDLDEYRRLGASQPGGGWSTSALGCPPHGSRGRERHCSRPGPWRGLRTRQAGLAARSRYPKWSPRSPCSLKRQQRGRRRGGRIAVSWLDGWFNECSSLVSDGAETSLPGFRR